MAVAEMNSSVEPGILANNYMQVMMLQTALSRSESNLNTVPRLIKRIIRENCWREWLDPDGRHVRWNAADFRVFLETKRPVERTLRGTETWEAFQELIRGERGGANNPSGVNQHSEVNRDIITVDQIADESPPTIPISPETPRPEKKRDYSREAPTGTSVSYSLRRLKSNGRDDLLEKVKAGKISVYAASIEAGFTKRKITIPDDPKGASRILVNRFKGDRLVTLIREMANWAGIEIVEPELHEELP
jgi:hypothetical protein